MRFNALGIYCRDIEASIAFYRSLGVELPEFDPNEGHYEAEIAPGIRFMMDSQAVMESFVEDFTVPEGNDQVGFAVEFDSAAAVDKAYARLAAAGAPTERAPFDAFWGQRYATVKDPDGNAVDLYSSL